MDLALYARVFWRFKFIMIAGLVLALALTVLSMAKITSHGLVYRKPEIWSSQSTLLLTQRGFPWGRTTNGPNSGYPGFSSLTDLYAQLANSDPVREIMRREGAPKSWTLTASPAIPSLAGGTLPVLVITGKAYTPGDAIKATQAGRRAFLDFVQSQQQAGGIPVGQRIQLQTLQTMSNPTIAQGRKKTLPIVIFLAVISATVALVFVLENLRPQPTVVETPRFGSISVAPPHANAEAGTHPA